MTAGCVTNGAIETPSIRAMEFFYPPFALLSFPMGLHVLGLFFHPGLPDHHFLGSPSLALNRDLVIEEVKLGNSLCLIEK